MSNIVLKSHSKWLHQAAAEIRKSGHFGWGNTCADAADAIDAALKAQGEPVMWWNPENEVAITPGLKDTWTLSGGGFAEDVARYTIPLYSAPPTNDRPTWAEVLEMIEAGCRATDVNDPAMPTEIAERIIAEFRKEKGK